MSYHTDFSQCLTGLPRPAVDRLRPFAQGRIRRVVGLTVEAVGLRVAVGQLCQIGLDNGQWMDAEVVGFSDQSAFLMPFEAITGLVVGAPVRPARGGQQTMLGEHLLGRVLNGLGQPLDRHGALPQTAQAGSTFTPMNPLDRSPIAEPLDVGIRTINALFTVGRGQRMGLFAGSGVGKSVLLGMMTRFTTAEIVVVGLIGERGREVKEFIEHILGPEGMARSVVIASPADDAPLLRIRAAQLTCQVAEHFRNQGRNVLLLMDSLTRYGQAQREISLAIGEPPATKGYPPSVFAKIPELVERAGNGEEGGGSITAFYTVLTEGDDLQDPIADSARAILDGHIVLSRRIAEEGLYPAIDVGASISRAMPQLVVDQQLQLAMMFKRLYARYQQNKDLISVGAYQPGSDAETDLAIERMPHFRQFLAQGLQEVVPLAESLAGLQQVLNLPAPADATNATAARAPGQAPANARSKAKTAKATPKRRRK